MTIKESAKKFLGPTGIKILKYFYNHLTLISNSIYDYNLYRKYSSVFDSSSFKNKESEITLRYHSIEKGFLHTPIKQRFAQARVSELLLLLEDKDVLDNNQNINVQSALIALKNYYIFHDENDVDISDYYSKQQFEKIIDRTTDKSLSYKDFNLEDYFEESRSDFFKFSHSRCSVRDFSGELIDESILKKAVDLANNAPSVCNRQPAKVYCTSENELVGKILKAQGGLRGYTAETIKQVMVLTCDRSYFYSVGERYQYYIDGGIYLMNLLYALHYYEVAACPAHWGKLKDDDAIMKSLLGLSDSEKVICVVILGKPSNKFKTALSKRRSYTDNLTIVN